MTEMNPLPFSRLLQRIFHEYKHQKSIFYLSDNYFYRASENQDFSCIFRGQKASTPVGPAAGPHTQMAQNIICAWLAGARIIELKTVQIMDNLEIPRPCIDATNVCYNVEWSQELTVPQSLEEYVKAWFLIHILSKSEDLKIGDTETLFDLSVGYDLKGIQSEKIQGFIAGMKDATQTIEKLRKQIPKEFSSFRDISVNPHIASGVTLSTFHGCPPDEIEKIAIFLMKDMGLNTVIKLNPTLLGYKKIVEIFHSMLGYHHIEVPQDAFEKDLQFDTAVSMIGRLMDIARSQGRHFGVKFNNTMVVRNKRDRFSPSVMYMSGRPLHLVGMTLLGRFRKIFGEMLPISFSAGVDALNFPQTVACNLAPITVCTDILRPGGYARIFRYLERLGESIRNVSARNRSEYILNSANYGIQAFQQAMDQNEWVEKVVKYPVLQQFALLLRQKLGENPATESQAQIFAKVKEAWLSQPYVKSSEQPDAGKTSSGQPDAEAKPPVSEQPELKQDAPQAIPAEVVQSVCELYQKAVAIAGMLNSVQVLTSVEKDERYTAYKNPVFSPKVGYPGKQFDCISAACTYACPVHINVPRYIDLIKQGKLEEAIEVIRANNPLPMVCGRVCSHPCETACRQRQWDTSVGIHELKRIAADKEYPDLFCQTEKLQQETCQKTQENPPRSQTAQTQGQIAQTQGQTAQTQGQTSPENPPQSQATQTPDQVSPVQPQQTAPENPAAMQTATQTQTPSEPQAQTISEVQSQAKNMPENPPQVQQIAETQPPTLETKTAESQTQPPILETKTAESQTQNPTQTTPEVPKTKEPEQTPNTWVPKEKKAILHDEKVAIVGAGPAGLTAAHFLAKAGYPVTIFEAMPKPGGMLAYGIPEFRLPEKVLQREIARIQALGVEIVCNTRIGKDGISLRNLKDQGFKAFFLAIGAYKSRKLGIQGENNRQCIDCLTFLREIRDGKAKSIGKRAAIVGGGNAAIDAARAAWRLDCEEVYLLYRRTRSEMPANMAEVEELEKEGIKIHECTMPVRILSENASITGIECMKTRLENVDSTGRPKPVPIEGSNFTLPVDSVIVAISQEPDIEAIIHEIQATISKQQTLVVDQHTLSTKTPGVFAGGDLVHGADTIIQAMGDGRNAAATIQQYLGSSIQTVMDTTTSVPEDRLNIPWCTPHIHPTTLAVQQRKNFQEVESVYTEEQAKLEASRCLQCDLRCGICVEVCPNRANFFFEIPIESTPYTILGYRNKEVAQVGHGVYKIRMRHQIGNMADLCNECGNCDNFCPETGGPYRTKSVFFDTLKAFKTNKKDGFYFHKDNQNIELWGRFDGATYRLNVDMEKDRAIFVNSMFHLELKFSNANILKTEAIWPHSEATISLEKFLRMRSVVYGMSQIPF